MNLIKRNIWTALTLLILAAPALAANGIEPIPEDSRISALWAWLIAAAMTGATLGVALKNSRRYNVE